jgi:hypothetical protein
MGKAIRKQETDNQMDPNKIKRNYVFSLLTQILVFPTTNIVLCNPLSILLFY